MTKLEKIDSKLTKLDDIEKDVAEIKNNVARLELKVKDLDTLKHRVDDIEQSVNFVSVSYEDFKADKSKIEKEINMMKAQLDKHSPVFEKLQLDNVNLRESVVDLRCRSMRDNLVFTNIPEAPLEECEKVLRDFIKHELHMDSDPIKFKRVHRIGRKNYQAGPDARPRPLIARFLYTHERDAVKGAAKRLKGTNYSINEQFPEEVGKYRREVLMPLLREARNSGKKAHISVDRLFIDNVPQKPAIPPPYRAPQQSSSAQPKPSRA
ncbi:protein unc-13 homolog C-like [Haliotis rufescens]|uniref:protein unc-13 homolog C-like n=1 Tax=Haliotis rufescens TaxID=6454 RepID=UPI001EB08FEA|nr:protein unc-13 homolog C-like [Haliotis rufescens]